MYYFFHGTDHDKLRAKFQGVLDALKKKRPEAEVINIDENSWTEGDWERLCRSQGLFDRKHIVIARGLGEKGEVRDFVERHLDDIKTSENAFLLVENVAPPSYIKELSKHAEKVFEFQERKVARPKFNVFDLADFFGKKDKKMLWVGYRRAFSAGIEPEQILGTLFWQIKNMALAKVCKDATGAGMKEFPFSKAKRFGENFTDDELKNTAIRLSDIYHEARSGGASLEIALEKFILSL